MGVCIVISMELVSEPTLSAHEPEVRCAVHKGSWRCKNTFPAELAFFRGKMQPLKNCLSCREKQRAKNKRPSSRACQKRARESEAGRASSAKRLQSEAFKKNRREWKKTEKGKECARRSAKLPAGRARAKRNGKKMHAKMMADPASKMQHYLRNRFNEMLRSGTNSVRVKECTDFESADEFKEHIESTFTEGMSWDNHGHRSEGLWNIGHRISIKMYDSENNEDLKRCWSMKNMFAQWSVENQQLGVVLPSDPELLKLRPIWPLAWGDQLPSQERRKELERCARNTFGLANP